MVKYSGMIMAYLDKFIIYSTTCRENSNISSYYIAIPKIDGNEYSLCIGLPNNQIDFTSKDSIVKIFNDNLEKLDSEKIIYAIPVIPKALVINEGNVNDDKIYTSLVQSLMIMVSDIFDEMISVHHKRMEQRVYLVANDIFEKSFFDWMDMKHPGLFQEIWLNNKKNDEPSVNNSFMNDDIGGTSNSGNALSGGPVISSYEVSKPKVKVLISPSKHGFSTITTLFLIIFMSLLLGIGLAIIIVK